MWSGSGGRGPGFSGRGAGDGAMGNEWWEGWAGCVLFWEGVFFLSGSVWVCFFSVPGKCGTGCGVACVRRVCVWRGCLDPLRKRASCSVTTTLVNAVHAGQWRDGEGCVGICFHMAVDYCMRKSGPTAG